MLAHRLPTELLKLIDPERDVADYRRLGCENYGGCLDEAVKRQWTSWTCGQCPLFARDGSERLNFGAARNEPFR